VKLIQLLVAFIALSFFTVPFAHAQETETPTESPSPTPAEKSEAKKDTEKKSYTEKATPEESASPAAKDAQKKEKTESAKTSAAAPAAAKPMVKGSVDAQLKDIEARWSQAFQTHDATVVEAVLAENFVLTDEKGKVFNRRGAIKDFRKNSDTLEKTTNSDVVVHPINRDAAVVTGMTRDIGKDKSGKQFDRSFRWTDTFVNRNGKWECVASHVALVSQK
jgi:ketosteroid isomerase-like protein